MIVSINNVNNGSRGPLDACINRNLAGTLKGVKVNCNPLLGGVWGAIAELAVPKFIRELGRVSNFN